MDQQLLIRIGIALAMGIVIGLIIGFALWHGDSGTCVALPSNTGYT